MKDAAAVHFRVVDRGLFLTIARRLGRDAAKVTYWTPSGRVDPMVRDCIGDGFDDVERVDCWLDEIGSVDCFVFPDVGFGSIQRHVRDLGIPVWGHMGGDEQEVSRGKFLDELKELGLPVVPYEKVVGISSLRDFLRDKDERWIKISKFRGDWETLHWIDYETTGYQLNYFAARFGPYAEFIAFYVFEPIETNIEDGSDTWCIDGQFPQLVGHGMEAKSKGYIGTFQKFNDLPEEVGGILKAFGPVLARYGYRGFFSTEVRITKDRTSYFIDPTCRAGVPPSQVMAEMIGNYAELVWQGANGNCIEPEPAAKFGVQVLCGFDRQTDRWMTAKIDPELDRWLKCGCCVGGKDMLWFPPIEPGTNACDWLVGIGDTAEEAVRHLKHNRDLLPDGVDCDYACLAGLLEEINEAEEKGMEFTEQPVPGPEVVVKNEG